MPQHCIDFIQFKFTVSVQVIILKVILPLFICSYGKTKLQTPGIFSTWHGRFWFLFFYHCPLICIICHHFSPPQILPMLPTPWWNTTVMMTPDTTPRLPTLPQNLHPSPSYLWDIPTPNVFMEYFVFLSASCQAARSKNWLKVKATPSVFGHSQLTGSRGKSPA